MDLTLHVWRQAGPTAKGGFVKYEAKEISSHEVEVTDKPTVLDPIALTSGDSK
jgi:hypothetical protein